MTIITSYQNDLEYKHWSISIQIFHADASDVLFYLTKFIKSQDFDITCTNCPSVDDDSASDYFTVEKSCMSKSEFMKRMQNYVNKFHKSLQQ